MLTDKEICSGLMYYTKLRINDINIWTETPLHFVRKLTVFIAIIKFSANSIELRSPNLIPHFLLKLLLKLIEYLSLLLII